MPDITEKEFNALKTSVENARSEVEQAKGALAQLSSRLSEEFECKDIKEAENLLREMNAKLVAAEEDMNRALKAYKKKWTPDE